MLLTLQAMQEFHAKNSNI